MRSSCLENPEGDGTLIRETCRREVGLGKTRMLVVNRPTRRPAIVALIDSLRLAPLSFKPGSPV